MTTITDMTVPDEVAKALRQAWINSGDRSVLEADKFAIRAALQAMCDCGMASISTHNAPGVPIFQLRLDDDERKRAPQEKRK